MQISFYNQNSAKNAMEIYIGGVSFYFSYNTLVGVRIPGNDMSIPPEVYVSQNYWGTTTGKHLNWIDRGDKKSRLKSEEFERYALDAKRIAKVTDLPTIQIT